MGDLAYLAILFALVALMSFGIAWVLARSVRQLARKQILLIAPLPLPALLFGFCAYMLVNAYLASADECGVDACAMAAAGAMMGITAAILVYLGGVAFAALGFRIARR